MKVTAPCSVCEKQTGHQMLGELGDFLWLKCSVCGDCGLWSQDSKGLERVPEQCVACEEDVTDGSGCQWCGAPAHEEHLTRVPVRYLRATHLDPEETETELVCDNCLGARDDARQAAEDARLEELMMRGAL